MVRAGLPAGVPRGCFGPKLEAAIAALTVRNRLSRRQLVELMEELFDAILGLEAVVRREAVGADDPREVGWYLSGEPRTLWGAFSKRTAVLRIAPDRGKQHLHGLIGDLPEQLVVDRLEGVGRAGRSRRH
jgi:transposase